METVEVVVRLSKFIYNNVVNYTLCGNLASAVRKGTVLPKGHGRLVDVDEAEAILHNKAFDMVESNAKFYTIRWVQKIVRNAPAVIEQTRRLTMAKETISQTEGLCKQVANCIRNAYDRGYKQGFKDGGYKEGYADAMRKILEQLKEAQDEDNASTR